MAVKEMFERETETGRSMLGYRHVEMKPGMLGIQADPCMVVAGNMSNLRASLSLYPNRTFNERHLGFAELYSGWNACSYTTLM